MVTQQSTVIILTGVDACKDVYILHCVLKLSTGTQLTEQHDASMLETQISRHGSNTFYFDWDPSHVLFRTKNNSDIDIIWICLINI